MDTHKRTLDMILQSLGEKNDLKGCNVSPTKRGRILVRIEYDGQKNITSDM